MGMSQRDFAKARLLPFLEEEGFLVANSKLTSWRFSEVIQLEETITIAGPGFQGVTLHQLLHGSGNRQKSGPTIALLTKSLLAQVLEAMELVLRHTPGFQFAGPAQILLGRDESGQPSILFLPPILFRRAMESRLPQEQSQLAGCYINPLLEGEEAAAFSQSVYLYQFLARTRPIQEEGLPFPELDPQRRLDDYRDQHFLPLELAVPGVNPPLAAAVNRNLRLGSRKTEATKAATTKKIPQQEAAGNSSSPAAGWNAGRTGDRNAGGGAESGGEEENHTAAGSFLQAARKTAETAANGSAVQHLDQGRSSPAGGSRSGGRHQAQGLASGICSLWPYPQSSVQGGVHRPGGAESGDGQSHGLQGRP